MIENVPNPHDARRRRCLQAVSVMLAAVLVATLVAFKSGAPQRAASLEVPLLQAEAVPLQAQSAASPT